MAIMDPIADMLTRVRNANMRGHKTVSVPHSNIKQEILKIFLDEGYIADFKVKEEKGSVKKNIIITLKYKGTEKVIRGLKRVSKPGLKVYSKAENLPTVLNGLGTAIISTSKGLLTDKEARTQNLGGEVLLFI
jgi:small subunit ribosomal protein S8